MFSAIGVWVASHFGGLLAGAGAGVAVGFVGKYIVSTAIDKNLGQFLDKKMLDLKNPDDLRLCQEVLRWIEKKIPDAPDDKQGDYVAAFVVKLLPLLKKQESKIADLVESAIAQLDQELKEREAK